MKLTILGHPDGRYSQQLLAAARDEPGVDVALHEFHELSSRIDSDHWTCGTRVGGDLTARDVVLVRTMPLGSLEQIIFRIDLLHRLEAAGVRVVNGPRCLEVAIDKYLTLGRLQQAGLPVPRTIACQTLTDAMEGFERLGGDVVVKPLFGGEGRGLMHVDQIDLAERAFKTLLQLGCVIYLQEYVAHRGHDVRILLLGDRWWSIRRSNDSDWRTNVSRGGRAEPFDPPESWLDLARRAAKIVDGWFVGVDLLPDLDGQPWLLEVNAVPGWDGVAAAHRVDVAAEVIGDLKRQLSN
ncbi:MAG: RimK family alpha-L-glutamate ligase [Planctomycetales bacterium]|nr:RimK family alpha-L-glutamate ligase [Planctomycetales bacterium]